MTLKQSWITSLRTARATQHECMKAIAAQPQLYRLRPEIGAEARLATVGNYVILFRIRRNVVRIERVVHSSRDLLAIMEEDVG